MEREMSLNTFLFIGLISILATILIFLLLGLTVGGNLAKWLILGILIPIVSLVVVFHRFLTRTNIIVTIIGGMIGGALSFLIFKDFRFIFLGFISGCISMMVKETLLEVYKAIYENY